MEVVMPSSTIPRPFPPNGMHVQPLVDEFAELEKIVKLRDAIYADKHPRFKPPNSTNPTFSQKVQSSPALPVVPESARPFVAPSPRVPQPINTSGKPTPTRAQTLVDPELNNVLLQKSDVLIKAENNLKRDRIERELKQQLENKTIEERLRSEGKSREVNDDDLDIESILTRAQALVNNFGSHEPNIALGFSSRNKKSLDDISDAMSIDQLPYDDGSLTNVDKETDMGEQSPIDHDMMEIDRVGKRTGNGNGSEIRKHKEKVLNTWSGSADTPPSAAESRRQLTPQTQISPRTGIDTDRSRFPQSPKGVVNPLDRGNDAPPLVRHASIRERIAPSSPMQGPRYSAIRTEEPVAPQPMRVAAAAAVTRLSAQDLIIDLRDDEMEDRPNEASHLESRRSPIIKAEPNTRPSSVVGAARRSPSPAGRSIRIEGHATRRPYYENTELSRYHYPHPLPPAHVHPTYDPYYRGSYPYPPPPPEYSARPYGVYSSRYPIYDEYSRLYHPPTHVISMHPPLPPLPPPRSPERHSSRAPERRPVSPEPPRRRHSSRSLSPRRTLETVRPAAERVVSRAQSLAPTLHRDYYERHLLSGPLPPGHYVDPYHPGYYVTYPPSERPVYYDQGGYYTIPTRPLPPPPHFLADLPPPPPREIRDGSVAPRATLVEGYRDRDYFYPPPSPMPPPPRPYVAIDHREYRELPREAYEARSRSVRPDVRMREEDYIRAVSVRPETHRQGYPPLLQAYPSPNTYRAMSTRPETSREAHRGEERAYMRGAIEVVGRDSRDEEIRTKERTGAVEEHKRHRDMDEQRRYRDSDDQHRYSREERNRAPAGYYESRYSPRR